MVSFIKHKIHIILIGLLVIFGCVLSFNNIVNAAPKYENDYASDLKQGDWVLNPEKFGVKKNKTLRDNIMALFYPGSESEGGNNNKIYHIIREISLGVMIIFIIIAGASLLLNKKPEESKKHIFSLMYILLGGVFIYAANWLFGDVLNFGRDGDVFTPGQEGISGVTGAFIGKKGVLFVILSAVKAFAFFLAIIMIAVTGFKVMAAGEGEKGKKLVRGLINVVVALLIIKGVDFIYYLAEDTSTFVKNASDFIINVAIVFAWIYGIIVFIMVLVAGYLYITDGGSGANFKKASNVLVNILLSALVLFGFLLITYQIFAEFQKGGDAVTPENVAIANITNQNYV